MPNYDGPTLRAVRENMGVPLRRVARLAGMSHGHLSKVERGEYGRPVTPAIVNAYERVCHVNLGEAAVAIAEQEQTKLGRRRQSRAWRPGELSDMRRSAFTAAVCALSVGGWLQEPYGRLLDSTGRPLIPAPPDEVDVAQLEQLAALATGLDLRYGGGLVSQFGKTLLRWAALMLETTTGLPKPVSDRLHRAVAALALRCAWSAFDSAAHESARSLFRLTLYTAVRGGDANLRGHAMADVAAQHNAVGYPEDALQVISIASGDDRTDPAVRIVLQLVKARAHATLGDTDACYHAIEAIEAAHAGQAGQVGGPDSPGWLATVATPARVAAGIGHALATLAVATDNVAVAEQAHQRLTAAVDAFDATAQARAHALCVAQLAVLHLRGEQVEQGAAWGRLALLSAATVHSARLTHNIGRIRGLAAKHPDQTEAKALVEEIDAATGGDQESLS